MQRQTAADALIDAGREVVAAIGSERDRSGEGGVGDPAETLVIGTLLVLAAAEAPILVVGVVGYGITAARDHERPISGFDSWVAIGATGLRGTGLLVGAALPVAAALGGSGLLGVEAGSVTMDSTPGPILATGIGVLALATWHAAVVGTVSLAAGTDWNVTGGVRFARSAVGARTSGALAGVAAGVGVVGIGVTAIPVVGSVVAAGVGAGGVVVASRVVGYAVDESELRGGSPGRNVSEDRLAAPTDTPGWSRRREQSGETGQHKGHEPGRSRATPRGPRRGHP
jgi:hypothetical protein